jgi:FkbM family methyltransferase
MDSKLIYDVGVHNGDDTAYYLHKGYRVVGIEANPDIAATLRTRFAMEISSGALQFIEAGIAEDEGDLDFFVCNENTEWSSFDPNKAAAVGATNRIIKVRTSKFSSILQKYGVPYYCKIDIEGNDHICLQEIDPGDKPAFVSVEMSHASGDRDLKRLRDLGYRRFKILSQVTFAPANPLFDTLARAVPWQITWRIRRLERRVFGKSRDRSWVFKMGDSGPFGDDLPGRWKSHDEALKIWRSLHELDKRRNDRGVGGNWFDIHATL